MRISVSNPRRLRAFTIVELLVVIAIIGLLVSLLLPAVQSARESARRIACANKIRQLGLASLLHHSSQKQLPYSEFIWHWESAKPCAPGAGVRRNQGSGASWIVRVLPYMEEQALFDQLKQAQALNGDFLAGQGMNRTGEPDNWAVISNIVGRSMEQFQCPSDVWAINLIRDQPDWINVPQGVTSYKGVSGNGSIGPTFSVTGDDLQPGECPAVDYHGQSSCNTGLMWRNDYLAGKGSRWRTMTDGSSRTFLLGEALPQFDQHSSWSFANGPWATCAVPPNHLITLSASEIEARLRQPGGHPESLGFRSRHPGSIHFYFADGAVHSISDTIDMVTYRALSTRNCSEVVNSFSGGF